MWQLSVRDENRSWTELGVFDGIGAAACRVLELERDPGQPMASLFFRVYADPLMEKSDAPIVMRRFAPYRFVNFLETNDTRKAKPAQRAGLKLV
jgi:hypothetical protein